MAEEIVNRVKESQLVQLDLERYYPQGERVEFDLSPMLWQGIAVKEKEFRAQIKEFDWKSFEGKYVAITCSTDAIIPTWAYMLITVALQPYVKLSIVGSITMLESAIYNNIFNTIDFSAFENKPIIVKGCGQFNIPPAVYAELTNRLSSVAKSIMFGEPCSTVPVWKKK